MAACMPISSAELAPSPVEALRFIGKLANDTPLLQSRGHVCVQYWHVNLVA